MPETDSTLQRVARVRMSDEWSDYTLYERLSRTVDSESPFEGVLQELSATEHKHFEFWRKYVPGEEPKLAKLKLYWVLFLRRFFGLTFATRYLDRHEANVVKEYQGFAKLIPDPDKAAFDEMVADERDHEKAFAMKVESAAVRYISFVVRASPTPWSRSQAFTQAGLGSSTRRRSQASQGSSQEERPPWPWRRRHSHRRNRVSRGRPDSALSTPASPTS